MTMIRKTLVCGLLLVGLSVSASGDDKHMNSAILTIVDADHYEVEGIGWENGAPAKEMCNGMKLVRKR